MRTLTLGAALLSTAFMLAPPVPLAAQQDGVVGSWVLDEERSETARDAMMAARRAGGAGNFTEGRRRGGRGGGGRAGMGRGRGGAGGGMGGQRPGGGPGGMRGGLMGMAMGAAPTMEISRADGGLTFTVPEADPLTMLTDKEEHTLTLGARDITAKAEEKSDEVKVEFRDAETDVKIERKYKLKDDGTVLEVETTVRNPRMQMNFRYKQYYNRAG